MDFSFRTIHLEGTRLTLRTLKPEDATQTYADWLNDAEVHRYLETKSATIESVREYIEKRDAQDNCLFLGMYLKETDQHIGTIKLEPINLENGTATIAIMIGERSAWGKGYGPEAMRLLINYGFTSLGLNEIDLGVIADNIGAIRSYEKVGFKETKRTHASVHYEDHLYDHITMTVTLATFRNEG